MYIDNAIKIIFNPNAHSGESKKIYEELIDELDRRYISYTVYETTKPKDAIEIASCNLEDNDIVFVVGGDGTVYETINGANGKHNLKFCIIPAGTGNDFYGTMKNSFSIEAAVDAVENDNIKKCNSISINDNITMALFLAYGIVIDIIMECRKRKKKNHLCYIKAAGKVIFSHKPTKFVYSIDNSQDVYVMADYIGFHNSSRAGGGIKISPSSIIDDDKFELVILKHAGFVRRILNFVAVFRHEIEKQPNYRSIPCTVATIKSYDDNVCCVDGELLQSKNVIARMNSENINFLV